VNTVYVIAVMTSLDCGADVLCLRAVEPDSTGEHAQRTPPRMPASLRYTASGRRLNPTLPANWTCGAYLRTPLFPTTPSVLACSKRVSQPMPA
jgi:hypothetical protein